MHDANDANQIFWTANALNAYGAIKNETHGTGAGAVTSDRTFMTNTPFVSAISAGGGAKQNLSYAWNAFGQLTNRSDANLSLSETFTYDLPNRVRSAIELGWQAEAYRTQSRDMGPLLFAHRLERAVERAGANIDEATSCSSSRVLALCSMWRERRIPGPIPGC